MSVRVRFAPSPTGYLHVGNARTAIVTWLFCRANKGHFLLRVDDTDAERSTLEYEAAMKDGMVWMGLSWDDSFNPRAFGDLMQQWGTSTVLLEAGGIEGDAQKQQLRQYTWVAIVAGLQAIADGSHASADPASYHQLPENGVVWPDLLISGATVHGDVSEPVQADVVVNFRHPLSFEQGRIADIGDLSSQPARRRIDARGLHLHALDGARLAIDGKAQLLLSRDAAGQEPVWHLDGDLLEPDPGAQP